MANHGEILKIEEVAESFETWANQPFISSETRQLILKSNLLVVPWLGFRSLDIPVFPVCTEELFRFLKDKAPPEVIPEICIEDKDYKEVALHGALLIVGVFVVTAFIAPLAVDLISEYIKRRIFKPDEDKAKARVELTVIEEGGKALNFKYEGPARDFRKTINAALKTSIKKPEQIASTGKSSAKPLPPSDTN
jgi:hypothetical protein